MAKIIIPKKNFRLLVFLAVTLLLAVFIGIKDSNYKTWNWKTYTNTKYGFSFKYPKNLDVTPTEIDMKAKYKDYAEKCESGVYEDCGDDFTFPDFWISFLRPSGKEAFSVVIYQYPIGPIGIDRSVAAKDNFTFVVANSPSPKEALNEKTFELIRSSLEFVEPEKPLACLWSTEMEPGLDPVSGREYIEKHKESLVLVSGYYLNSTSSSCQKTTSYIWKGLERDAIPPFKTLEECETTCLR